MISDTISKKIFEAMKAKDEVRLSTLKMLSAALTNAEIEKKREKLTKEEEVKIVRTEAKKRKDAIELYEKGGAKEKAEREKKELEILREYLPKQMAKDELLKLVDQAVKDTNASDSKDIGRVMGVVMAKAQGKADGKKVAEIVRSKLS